MARWRSNFYKKIIITNTEQSAKQCKPSSIQEQKNHTTIQHTNAIGKDEMNIIQICTNENPEPRRESK